MDLPPIQFRNDVANAPPVFAIDVKVLSHDGTDRPLTRADLETAYETGVPFRGTCRCKYGFVHEGFVTPQGRFAKSWRPPLPWAIGLLKWVPLVTLDGVDFTAAYRPSIAVTIGTRVRVRTAFGVLEGGDHPYPPGHPHTPGNAGLAEVALGARSKVRKDVREKVRYALVKGSMDTFFDGRETTRNTIMLVYDATLSDVDLAKLRGVLEAAMLTHCNNVRAEVKRRGRKLRLPPAKAAVDDVVGALGSMGVCDYDDDDIVS